ncbi:MAG TPA: hypothetical protein PLO89_01540 [Spirochaetota bacterium]|nr:hypothetical protein [Spirochaetota bacterium]
MVGGIEFNTYQRIAKMTHSIDSVISEANQAKAQLSTNFFSDFSSFTKIGGNVDMLA